jgi:hypothetical protein
MSNDTSDDFAVLLFEEAKRFLEKSRAESSLDGQTAYLHASLLLGYCALEAHINSVGADFVERKDLSLLHQSILQERDVALKSGQFELTESLKVYRLEDRFEFICRFFSGQPLDKSKQWWGTLKDGLKLRNGITHPREPKGVSEQVVARILDAILESLDALYVAVYRKSYPGKGRKLDSRLDF